MVGRKEEISVLEDCIASGRPEFVVLYGRRRVGKTFLVKEFFNDTFSFYATGVQNTNTRTQLRVFKEALSRYGDQVKTIPKDWLEAFSRLENLLRSEKVTRDYKSGRRVVFLDELSWMDGPRSDFKTALDYFWNSWGSSQKDLLLIVCGSATSWIINNIVRDTGGFYNRITRQIHLMPFDLNECEQLLISNGVNYTRKQIVEGYMIFGGIPYYLNYIIARYSLAVNVDMLFFRENGPLRCEFHQLFSSLFGKSEKYTSIVKELSLKKYGLTRQELISTGNVVEGKELTKCLEELEQCGFIRSFSDYSSEKNGKHFQLMDPLCLFHFAFLENSEIGSWLEFLNTPAYFNWCGLSFEKVCLAHTKQIKKTLGISGVFSRELSWKSKKSVPGAQIDLIIDRKDDVINICEIKYTIEPYSLDAGDEEKLVHMLAAFREETHTKKALWLTLISFSGILNNPHSNIIVNELSGDDLFG